MLTKQALSDRHEMEKGHTHLLRAQHAEATEHLMCAKHYRSVLGLQCSENWTLMFS